MISKRKELAKKDKEIKSLLTEEQIKIDENAFYDEDASTNWFVNNMKGY